MATGVGQVALIGALLFVAAGRLDWLWAWVYLVTHIAAAPAFGLVLPRELIAERGTAKANVKRRHTSC